MIDWVNAHLPYKHTPLESGSVLSISPSGEIEWETSKHMRIVGSHESSVQVRSDGGNGQGTATFLHFVGNPSKFLQGHNVFGSDDLLGLMLDTYLKILNFMNLPINFSDYKLVLSGEYEISRLDINYMFELRSRKDVLSWIRAAESSSLTRHGRPTTKGGTLYWGKNSKRWAFKAYSKGEELEKNKLPYELTKYPIEKWADNKLRLELVLRSKELKEALNIKYAKDLTEEKIKSLYNKYIRRIDMNNKLVLTTKELDNLPPKLKSTYVMWKEGYNCRLMMQHATFYRHRKALKNYGINIDLEPNSQKDLQSNVIPLVKVLEAKPASIPDWAYYNNLIFSSNRKAS